MIIWLGLLWGSFIGAIASRLVRYVHFIERHPSFTPASYVRSKKYFFNYFLCDRSKCDSCRRPIHFSQNIPFLSYLLQKGRCNFCQSKIPLSVLFFECVFLGISILLYARCPTFLQQLYLLVVFSLLILIGYLDFKTHRILSVLSYTVMWLGFYSAIFFGTMPIETSLLSTLIAYGCLKLLGMIYFYGLNKVALGDADPLLAGAIGAWIYPIQIPYFFSISAFGMLLGIFLFSNKKQVWKTEYPFGVGLTIAGFILITYNYLF